MHITAKAAAATASTAASGPIGNNGTLTGGRRASVASPVQVIPGQRALRLDVGHGLGQMISQCSSPGHFTARICL